VLSINKRRHCSFDRLGKCDRESEHYVNCPLDTTRRCDCKGPPMENDVKITVIMKAAIGQVLTGWDAFLKAFCLKVNIATAVPGKGYVADRTVRSRPSYLHDANET